MAALAASTWELHPYALRMQWIQSGKHAVVSENAVTAVASSIDMSRQYFGFVNLQISENKAYRLSDNVLLLSTIYRMGLDSRRSYGSYGQLVAECDRLLQGVLRNMYSTVASAGNDWSSGPPNRRASSPLNGHSLVHFRTLS